MKLYFAPGACSRAARIALHEAGLPFQGMQVNLQTHQLADGTDYYAVNPKGYVPTLVLDDGQQLTEAGVVLQWIADQAPAAKLAPAAGTMPRYRLMEWLNFVTTEVHKQFSPLFNPAYPEEAKRIQRDKILQRMKWIDGELAGRQYLAGDTFSVADIYLWVICGWADMMQLDLSALKNLAAWRERIAARPAVRKAVQEES